MPQLRRAPLGLLLMLSLSHCAKDVDDRTQVRFFSIGGEGVPAADRPFIEATARAAVAEARRHLPQLPPRVIVRVQPGRGMGATGETGTTGQPDTVIWTVDLRHPGGPQYVAKTWLRASMLHELHHLVREAVIPRITMLDNAVTEGMATVFERDVARVAPPWGKYPANVASWVDELRDVPGDTQHRKTWMWRHADGRRWVVHKAGTYLVDRAVGASGRSASELVRASTDEVMRLAGIEHRR